MNEIMPISWKKLDKIEIIPEKKKKAYQNWLNKK